MTMRCWFITSSYLRTFLRTSKFCCSTWVCALLIARVTILASIGTSSGRFSRVSSDSSAAPLKRVVDTARLVPLGAQHVQPTGLGDLFGFGGGLLLDDRQLFMPGRLVLVGGLDRGEAAAAEPQVGE